MKDDIWDIDIDFKNCGRNESMTLYGIIYQWTDDKFYIFTHRDGTKHIIPLNNILSIYERKSE